MTERASEGPWPAAGGSGRDSRLGLFAIDGELDGAIPSGQTVTLLDELAAPSEPGTWDPGLLHEIAAVLRISWQAAWPLAEMAWHLEQRLPGAGELLRTGVLSWVKAQIVTSEFAVLDDQMAAEAERRLLERDLGADDMTPGKPRRLCQRTADTLDPDGAARRRQQAERDEARVSFYRAHGGAAAMTATGLPTDDALKASANVQKRALEYKAAGIRENMDCQAGQEATERAGADNPGQRADPGGPGAPEHDPGTGSGPVPAGMPDPGLPSLVNFTLPLATALGLAQRPGEVPGYESVDPALAARLIRDKKLIRDKRENKRGGKDPGPPGSRDGPAGDGWGFTPDGTRPGPNGGYGAWILSAPGGRRYRIAMHATAAHL